MKCRDFEDRLNYLLDERVEPAADVRLADHAHDCPPCRKLLDDQHVVLAMIKEAPLPATSSGFARRVVSRAAPLVGVRRQVLPRRTIWAIGTLLATAAAVLLAVSLVWQARQGA